MALSSRFDDALVYAALTHASQTRKRGGVPYISHLLSVTGSVLEAGGDEDTAIAALLHDAAEDQGGFARLDDIRSRFGPRVADLVQACSDNLTQAEEEKRPWKERKDGFIDTLQTADPSVHLIAVADKLANVRSMIADVGANGIEGMEAFTGGVRGTLWYLRAVLEVLRKGPVADSQLVQELDLSITRLARLIEPG